MNNNISNKEKLQSQYQDDKKLNIRKALHSKYSINKQGFGNWLYEQYNVKEKTVLLELGSGNGDFFHRHMDELTQILDITLSDFSEGMVNIMKEKYKDTPVKVEQVDIQNIPFEDDTFDVIVANAMLYHVPDIDAGLKEVKRVLKPGGVFYTSTFGENGLFKYISTTLESLFDKSIDSKPDHSFTLENGQEKLMKHFNHVERRDYEDGLKVTDAKDMVDYIDSMTSITEIGIFDYDVVLNYFDDMVKEKGSIDINKAYGMFKASLYED